MLRLIIVASIAFQFGCSEESSESTGTPTRGAPCVLVVASGVEIEAPDGAAFCSGIEEVTACNDGQTGTPQQCGDVEYCFDGGESVTNAQATCQVPPFTCHVRCNPETADEGFIVGDCFNNVQGEDETYILPYTDVADCERDAYAFCNPETDGNVTQYVYFEANGELNCGGSDELVPAEEDWMDVN